MVGDWVKRAALAAAVGALLAGGAGHAQDAEPNAPADATAAPAKAPPKMAKPKVAKLPFVTVVVTNHRTVGLVELTATLSSGGDAVKIAGPLAAGKKVVAHVAHDKACLFDLKGSFADGAETETESIDLCKDKKVELQD